MFRWILLSSLAVMSCASSSVPPRSNQDVVWDFRPTGTTDWRPLNDGVMGGRSTGNVAYGDSAMVWRGATSLENNGGFASLRAPWGHLNLSQARDVVLTCRGTGGPFKLTMETSERWWMPYAYASFSPSEDWGERLGKTVMQAQQLSARRGELRCEMKEDHVQVSGQATTFLEGTVHLNQT